MHIIFSIKCIYTAIDITEAVALEKHEKKNQNNRRRHTNRHANIEKQPA